jgi:hypothetical protein
MRKRTIMRNVHWLGAVDWDRRLFDSLIPLPDGTTYNAYLVEGNDKTALLDTVDPPMADKLIAQLAGPIPWQPMPLFWPMPCGPRPSFFPSSVLTDGGGRRSKPLPE